MQSLQYASNSKDNAEHCAAELLATVPAVMRYIRREMRSHRRARLSVPQFRALIFASVHKEPSLSSMAEHIGISLPAASRMIDGLVRRGLLERRPGLRDRRHISISVTRRGRAEYRSAHQATRAALAGRFETISSDDRLLIARATKILGRIFGTLGTNEGIKGAS